ncbi:MAG: DUF5398 family protein [Verrucomicrobia bacterium]|nr:DUF5398 family protein [Verrucomicrobiota bacterium]
MFGLQGKKKDKLQAQQFDLEKEFKDPDLFKKYKDRVEKKIQLLKNNLRGGESKEDFDSLGVLLHGYAAMQKLMVRVTQKQQKEKK